MTQVDLRSDTVTRPTPAMRRAMAEAEVGDDVFGDDPTVRALEHEVAGVLGKPAALFTPSGTMANQLAMAVLAGPGTEVILDEGAHILNYEGGAAAALFGVTLRGLSGDRGRLGAAQIEAALRPVDEHFAPVAAVAFENTHNRAGGATWSLDELSAAAAAARRIGARIHLDGARLWNAAAARGYAPAEAAAVADTVSVCFSKGLGAPVGSALASDADTIRRARAWRKRLGGGMRQAGIIAAGALHALRHHRERLVDDHRRAARLAGVLESCPGVRLLPVETNIVIADLSGAGLEAEAVVAALAVRGILVIGFGRTRIRLVAHLDVDDDAVERAAEALRAVLGGGA